MSINSVSLTVFGMIYFTMNIIWLSKSVISVIFVIIFTTDDMIDLTVYNFSLVLIIAAVT